MKKVDFMSRWDKLSIGDRAALVSLFVDNGVFDPKEMRRIYDEGGDTADIKPAVIEASYPREKEVLELVNNSKADFVSRLKDDNRVTIPDWKDANKVATHKLAYAQDGNRWIIYPLVQNIDGNLYDFEDPKYGMDKGWQALDSALYSGDYVELPSKADARWFTESYKNHYPGFNKYEDGGDKKYGVDAISGADTNPVDTDPQKSKTAWFDWWYKYRGKQIDDERKASGKYLTSKNKYNTDFLNYVNSRINNVGESYNDINGEIDSPEFITAASKDSVARKQILDYGHDYNSDDYVKSANIVDLITRGFYTPGLNHIIYNPRNGRLRDDTIIHERTHTLRDNPFYYNYTSAARKFVKDGNHILMDNNDFDNYLDSHKEVYARLNAFRYTNNLNPSHNITKDEINVFRKNGLLKKYDLDRYTDDWLYFLFNGLADSGEPIQNWSGVNSAALGGLFNMYDGKTERSQKISRGYYQDKDGDIYDGARSGSQRMVRLGNDDYFVPEEFGPAVVTAGKGDKPKIEIPINYLFPGGSDVDEVFDVIEPSVKGAVNLRGLSRKEIKDKAYDLAGEYGNNDDLIGTKRQKRIFNRAQKRFYSKALERQNVRQRKSELINAIKQGDAQAFNDYITEGRDRFAQKYIQPVMIGLGTAGASGGLGALLGMAGDLGIYNISGGKKDSFGDLVIDRTEHPYLSAAAEFLNPLNAVPILPTVNTNTINNSNKIARTAAKELNKRVKAGGLSNDKKINKFIMSNYLRDVIGKDLLERQVIGDTFIHGDAAGIGVYNPKIRVGSTYGVDNGLTPYDFPHFLYNESSGYVNFGDYFSPSRVPRKDVINPKRYLYPELHPAKSEYLTSGDAAYATGVITKDNHPIFYSKNAPWHETPVPSPDWNLLNYSDMYGVQHSKKFNRNAFKHNYKGFSSLYPYRYLFVDDVPNIKMSPLGEYMSTSPIPADDIKGIEYIPELGTWGKTLYSPFSNKSFYADGGPVKTSFGFDYNPELKGEFDVKVPYYDEKYRVYGNLSPEIDFTQDIINGDANWYTNSGRDYYKEGYSFYKTDDGRVIGIDNNIDWSAYPNYKAPGKLIGFNDVIKMLPKRDYIGGDKDASRANVASLIPGFTEEVAKRAASYGIDKDLMYYRLSKEGFLDSLIKQYNNLSANEQKSYNWNNIWYNPVSGYGQLGLDYAGDNLLSGKYKLNDSNASWIESDWTDDEGGTPRAGISVITPDLYSALEIFAAEMKYRQDLVRKKYGVSGSDINTYTNAIYNMGPNHKDLNNRDYIIRNYTVPAMYKTYGFKY